jgi:hypothetical protein
MREKRQNNDLLQQESSNDVIDIDYFFFFRINFHSFSKKQDDILQQAVEREYTTLYRQVHKAAQKTAR